MTASEQISSYIESLPDWRGVRLTQLRELINTTAPDLTEEWKWNTPVWSKNGVQIAISGFKNHVKINFMHGAEMDVPATSFNNGFDSKLHRSIDFFESDHVDEPALRDLIRLAANYTKPRK